VAAELVIFLPESVEEPELKALMSEAEGIAAELNIQIMEKTTHRHHGQILSLRLCQVVLTLKFYDTFLNAAEAEGIAAELNIQIIGGQTRVSSAVRQPPATATGEGGRTFTAVAASGKIE